MVTIHYYYYTWISIIWPSRRSQLHLVAGRATIASQTIYIIIYQIWFTKNVPNSQYIIIHVHVNYNVHNYTGKI